MDREDGDQLVIELSGGGSLGYAVFGDPDGLPCFAFHGTSSSRLMPGWMFPPGYEVTLVATVAATTLAGVLAALVARHDALVTIPVSLGIWAITGLGVAAAGLQLGHTGLTHLGIILVAASLIGAAVGTLVAGRRGRPGQPTHGPAATSSAQAGPRAVT